MDKDCPIPEPFSGAIGSILFLTLLFFLTFIGRFIFAPLMPAMSGELGLSHSQAGSIFLFGSWGYLLALFRRALSRRAFSTRAPSPCRFSARPQRFYFARCLAHCGQYGGLY